MKFKFHYSLPTLILPLKCSLLFCQVNQNQEIYAPDNICRQIHTIVQDQYKLDSTYAFAMIYDASMPEDWYALFAIDTVKGELIRATSYVYRGKVKYLTKYFYFNDKLILTNTSKCLIRNQDNKKWAFWDRAYTYWNDSLVCTNPPKEDFPIYKDDLKIAGEILRKFKSVYSKSRLHFENGSNIGFFK